MTQNETFRINIEIDDRDLSSLDNAISDLQSTLSDLNGTLRNSVSQVQDTVGEFNGLETATELAVGALDTLTRTFEVVTIPFNELNQSLDALTGVKDAFTNATNTARIATDKKTTSMGLATLAAKGLTIAMKALPFVGIAAMALSLISTFARLFSSTRDTSDATDDFAERLRRLKEELDENRVSHESNIRSIRVQNQTMRDLVSTIAVLNSQTELSTEEYNQLRLATMMLNDATDGYTLSLCETTGRLDENGTAVLLNMVHYQNLAAATEEVEENLDRLLEMYNSKNYATERVEKLREATGSLGLSHRELNQKIADSVGEFEELNNKFEAGEITLVEFIESHQELSEEITNVHSILEDMCEELRLYEVRMYDAKDSIEQLEETLIDAYENMGAMTTRYLAHQTLSWDSLSEHQQGVMNDLKSMITDYTAHATSRMGGLSDEVTITGREMIDNMIENQRIMETWADNIAILAYRGIDEGLLDELRRAGPEGAAEVAARIAMCDNELAQLNEVYGRGAQVATDTMATQLGEGFEDAVNMASHFVQDTRSTMLDEIANADFESIGKEIPAGAARGIARDIEAIKAVEDLVQKSCGAFIRGMGINSPSHVFKGYGENIIQGLCNGLERLTPQSVRIIGNLAREKRRIYNNVDRDYTTIGRQIMTGLNQGLLNGEGQVMSTAQRIANNISRTMRQALDINSPSRVMREQIGRQIPAGIGAGIEKYADVALDQAYKLGLDLVKLNIPSVESMISLGHENQIAQLSELTFRVVMIQRVQKIKTFFVTTINKNTPTKVSKHQCITIRK